MMTYPLTDSLPNPLFRAMLDFRRSLGWRVTSLFANGEQGVWYDPSDLSTLFQDSAGTTPVTAVGQPVGLMLDKSKGLVLGPELVTNGALTSGTGWTDTGIATITYSTAGARIVSPANGATLLSQNYAGAVNKTYVVDAEVVMHATPLTAAAVAVNIGGFGEDLFVATQIGLIAGNTYRLHGKVRLTSATTFNLRIGSNLALNYALDFTIRNLSVRELPGNHASQATAGKRPLLKAGAAQYLDFDIVDDALVAAFPAALGSTCTVALAVPGVGASILTGQTIGTTYTLTQDTSAVIITTDALTAGETTSLTAWLNAKAGV